MAVALNALRFNHDPNSSARSALNIRRDAAQPALLPEWQRGVTSEHSHSIAAYSIEDTADATIEIEVWLARTDPTTTALQIRAIEQPVAQPATMVARPPELPPAASLGPYWRYQYYLWQYYYWWYLSQLQRPATHGFGNIETKVVSFAPGERQRVELFTLLRSMLWNKTVGLHDVELQWQQRLRFGDEWKPFATTRHRIYRVLRTPTAPWTQQPFRRGNTQLPWSDILDYACRWAAGAATVDESTTQVTRAVFDLGPDVLSYGCPLPQTMYAHPVFNATAFLDRLRGGFGNGGFVNCTDCATVVSTFSNILGADLWQSRMGPSGTPFRIFGVNPILAIGDRRWATPCGVPGSGFTYHEVAWKGGCDEDDQLFDACLKIDGYGRPTRPPRYPLLAANIRFGRLGEGLYRDMLASPAGRAICLPQPTTKRRRYVI